MSIRRPLDLIEVKSPCQRDWDRMSGSDQTRFCDHCQRHVHDLSAMTLRDAEALICRDASSLCVRFTRLADGKLRTLDYCTPKERKAYGWRFWTAIVAVAAAIGGCVLTHSRAPTGGGAVMGAMMPLNPPPGGASGTSTPPCQDQ